MNLAVTRLWQKYNFCRRSVFVAICLLIIGQSTIAHANSQNWEAVNSGLTNLNLTDVVIDGQGNIYAATTGDGIFKSSSSNPSWAAINSGLSNLYINSIVASGGGNIFAATNGGMFMTSDGGATWTSIDSVSPDSAIYAIATDGKGDIYAGVFASGSTEIIKSEDDGVSWSVLYSGLEHEINALAIDGAGNIYAGTYEKGIFKGSSDGTANWEAASNGLVGDPYAYAGAPPSMTILSIAVDAMGNVYAGTEGGLFKSNNNGANWEGSKNVPTSRIHTITVDNNQNFYIGTGSGSRFGGPSPGKIFRSIDGGANWKQVRSGLQWTVFGLVTDSNGNVYAATVGGGVLQTNVEAISISGVTSGSMSSSISLTAKIAVAFNDEGKSGFLFVHAAHPKLGEYLLGPDGWVSFDQSTTDLENLIAHSSVTLGTHSILVMTITPFDLVVLNGVTVTVGYGRSASDLVNKQTYELIYTFQ